MVSDGELLQRFVNEGSEPAFTELVSRHINLVYRAALRRVGGNAHAADDVTQRVFTDLSRKARSLCDRQNLAGWLYTGTRYAAAEVVRSETRRRTHELEANAMNELQTDTPLDIEPLVPFLDEILDSLGMKDREAVLLHTVEDRTFAEIGQILALSPDAARMRVNRALEKARMLLKRRGVASTAAALATTLSSQSMIAGQIPSAPTIARVAIQQAPPLAAPTFLGLRLSRLAAWVGGVALVGTIASAVKLTYFKAAAPAPTNESARIAEIGPQVVPSADVAATPEAAPAVVPTVAKTTSVRRAVDFNSLSNPEKNVLKRLWLAREEHPPAPGARNIITIVQGSNGEPGSADLLARGFISPGVIPRSVGLTGRGLKFCEVYQDDIAKYPLRLIQVGSQ
jgi:RNA polymerase sigma factor (sigma-70 family)